MRLEHEISADELTTTVPLLNHQNAERALTQLSRSSWSIVQADRRLSDQEPALDGGAEERLAALCATVGDLVRFGHLSPPEALACAHFVASGELPNGWDCLDGNLIGDRGGQVVPDGQ